jgi:hypothetical protein
MGPGVMTLMTGPACRGGVTLIALLVAALAGGCRDAERDRIRATTQLGYNSSTGTLSLVTADLDRNGRIDTVTFLEDGRILRSERDRDEDGRADFWEFNVPDGTGGLDHTAEDSNRDGKPDKWDYYTDGILRRTEWADSGQDTPSRRWNYAPDGTLESVESEPDGTGGFRVRRTPSGAGLREVPQP